MVRTSDGEKCCLNDGSQPAADLEAALRAVAFCEPGVLWLADVSNDERFQNNPALLHHQIRFAAAVPVRGANGERTGTLAIYDQAPRQPSTKQKKLLIDLASLISSHLNLLPLTSLDSGSANKALRSGDAVFWQDLQGTILAANHAFSLAAGYDAAQLAGMNMVKLLSPKSAAECKTAIVSLLGGSISLTRMLHFVHRVGSQSSWLVEMSLQFGHDNQARVLCVARNDASRTQWSPGLEEILKAISPVTGEAFFRSLVSNLTGYLGIQFAFAAELLEGEPQRIRTLASSLRGAILVNQEYEIAATPCEVVLQGEFQWFASAVQSRFPDSENLRNLQIESYIGVPLRSAQGKVIGLLAILDTKQWTPDPRIEAALKLFAMRAAAEVERLHAEAQKERLLELLESSSELVALLSVNGELLYGNRSLREICGLTGDNPTFASAYLSEQFGVAREVINGQAGKSRLELCILLKNAVTGRPVPAEFSARLITSAKSSEQDFIAITGQDLSRAIAGSKALIEADQQYLTTISSAAEGIVLRRKDGSISACNGSARAIFGLPADLPIDQISYQRWDWRDENGVGLSLEAHPAAVALRTGISQSAVTLGVTRADGTLIWLSLTSVPLIRPGSTTPYGVISTFSDITLQREYKLGLKELNRLSSSVYRTIEDLYDDYIRTGCEIFGMAHGYLSQAADDSIFVTHSISSLEEIRPGLFIPYEGSACSVVIEQGVTVAVEDTKTETVYRSPEIFRRLGIRSFIGAPVLLADNVYGVLGFFSEQPKAAGFFSNERLELLQLMSRSLGRMILEEQTRKSQWKAEAELRHREHLFRSIIETTSDFICILGADRQWKYISPSIARTLALATGNVDRISITDVISFQDLKAMVRQEKIWLSAPGKHPAFELKVKSPEGKLIYLECTATNLLAVPEVAGIVLGGRDITERKMAQLLDMDRNQILEMIARSEPAHDVFREITAMVERQQVGAKAAILLLRRGQLFWECAPRFPVDLLASFPRISVNPHNGCYALAAHSRQKQLVTDLMFDAFWRPRRRLAAQLKTASCLAAPVVSAFGQTLGVCALHFEQGLEIEERHHTLIQAAVSMAAISMEHNLLNDQLSYQSQHDALTGLPNRLQLQDRLPLALEDALTQSKLLAVCFIDLDRFKQINDTLGHTTGDRLLEQVSRRLKYCVRKGGLLARMGGDEFTVVLSGLANETEALHQAEELLASLRAPFQVDGHELFVTASMGISLFPRDGRDVASLLRNADSAMYMAKHRGNDSLEFFKPGLGATALRNLEMETYLRRAIDNNELRLLYQPQVDLDGRVESVEALVKWDHPKLGRIAPSQFIPIAEESGMIVPIGAWVLRQACLQNAAWQSAGLRPIRVGVNVSAVQFARPDFVSTVANALEDAGLNPRFLDLELTESMLVRDLQESAARMAVLREVGVSISIDDFGTGYSSLSYLRRLPADTLKIDQSFLRESSVDAGSLAVIQTIVSLAHNLGLNVVAEGVETAAHLDLIRMSGCDKAQGHFFGEAITPDEVAPLLRDPHQR